MRSDSHRDAGGSVAERPIESGLDSKAERRHNRIDEPLRLVHHHPGYLRIRADAFLQTQVDDPIVSAARSAAETVPGFCSWSLNPKTGSVVIQYEPGVVEADDLLKHIAKCAGFQGVEIATRTKANRQELVSGFLDSIQGINRVVDQLTGGRADLRELAPAALAAVSVVSFLLNQNRGRIPEWSGALYHSYRIFMHWHRPEVRTRERIGRQEDERAGDQIVDLGLG
jgi:Heavy metal associated domain 2